MSDHINFAFNSSFDDDVDGVSIPDEVVPPLCEGIPRRLWVGKCVVLYKSDGVHVARGICRNVSSDVVIGTTGPFGDSHVAVQISSSLSFADVPDEWRYSMRAWPVEFVFCNGASFRDHELRAKYNSRIALLSTRPLTRKTRPYTSTSRNPSRPMSTKYAGLLRHQDINFVATRDCCSHRCAQTFPREKIRTLRERLYVGTSFQFRCHMKLDVHRQTRTEHDGRKVVTLEGLDVCHSAWRHIMGVSESTFYRYAKYASQNMVAQLHGNSGLRKPRPHTVQATATLKCILEKSADHMLHKSRVLSSGEKVVTKVLSATWKWKDTIPELNIVNTSFGLKVVSESNVNKIRRRSFEEYDAKKPGDNFSQCSSCDKYHSLRKLHQPGTQAALLVATKLQTHLNKAWAHRDVYAANRYRSKCFPHECVTIMHDKMDHAKTASPVFSHKTKHLDGLTKLPLSMTGMLAHGQGDVRYAHYGLDLYPHDANYTVGSFAKLLRDLELPPKSSSRVLFQNARSLPLYEALLHGVEVCESSLPPPLENQLSGAPLPPILNVQMDNATGDNKNRFVFCFWSLLVANKIFREVYVNFMIVGHTHDDIDALHGRWSMALKKESFPTIPLLMKSFMVPSAPYRGGAKL